MKVFEVVVEYQEGDTENMVTECQYVTSEVDTLKSVTDYFAQHCVDYQKHLIGVREVMTISQHLVDHSVA